MLVGIHATSRTRGRLVGKTEMTILRVRLETAGEAKILYKLTLGDMNTNIPVIGIMMAEHHAHCRQLQSQCVSLGDRAGRSVPVWTTTAAPQAAGTECKMP